MTFHCYTTTARCLWKDVRQIFREIYFRSKNVQLSDKNATEFKQRPNYFWLISRPRSSGIWCGMQLSGSSILASDSGVNIQRRRMSARTKRERELLRSRFVGVSAQYNVRLIVNLYSGSVTRRIPDTRYQQPSASLSVIVISLPRSSRVYVH